MKDWKELCIYNVIVEAVARVSSKAFVGLPLCKLSGIIPVFTLS